MSRTSPMIGGTIASGALLLFGALLGHAAESLPDPTRPPAASLIAAPAAQDTNEKLELRAIFHAEDRRFAVINGRRVQTADRIAGAEVLAIEVDRVRLRRDGEIVELELVAPAFKNARQTGLPSASRRPDRTGAAEPDALRGAMR
ncbi:MAG: hypothetical protein IPK00_23960 [Deltaproteobacteria bacterium]|nr:hypothetical protein [Deltaproteobacteria bacterium]